MMGTGLQATDLAARINYVATQFALDGREQNQLHTFRLTSNDILNHRKEPSEQEFLRDLRAVAYAYRKIFHEDIPPNLYVASQAGNDSCGKEGERDSDSSYPGVL